MIPTEDDNQMKEHLHLDAEDTIDDVLKRGKEKKKKASHFDGFQGYDVEIIERKKPGKHQAKGTRGQTGVEVFKRQLAEKEWAKQEEEERKRLEQEGEPEEEKADNSLFSEEEAVLESVEEDDEGAVKAEFFTNVKSGQEALEDMKVKMPKDVQLSAYQPQRKKKKQRQTQDEQQPQHFVR